MLKAFFCALFGHRIWFFHPTDHVMTLESSAGGMLFGDVCSRCARMIFRDLTDPEKIEMHQRRQKALAEQMKARGAELERQRAVQRDREDVANHFKALNAGQPPTAQPESSKPES